MFTFDPHEHLSNTELLERVELVTRQNRSTDVQLVVLLGEVERRRIHLELACSSMWDFCRRKLGMSGGQAFRRMTASRLATKYPALLEYLDDGTITMSALAQVRDYISDANWQVVVDAIAGKSRAEIARMVATWSPRPDVLARLRRLPKRRGVHATTTPGDGTDPRASTIGPGSMAATSGGGATSIPARDARLDPLSATRFRLQMTVSEELHDKVLRARDLMRHRNPTGDLAVVIEAAVDALLVDLEAQRIGRRRPSRRRPRTTGGSPETTVNANRPTHAPEDVTRRTPAAPEAATVQRSSAEAAVAGRRADGQRRRVSIPRRVREAIFDRDGEQCTYVDPATGERCPSRSFLEIDHIDPEARGGPATMMNLRVACHAHNKWYAERSFGRAHVDARIRAAREMRGPADH